MLFIGLHRHFVLYGLMEYMRKSFEKQFTADEILQLLDRFFNLEMLVRFKIYVLCYLMFGSFTVLSCEIMQPPY
ncbi:hypothetical protein MA16_Dca022376 [Dendrobium catenatum]|uniref:Uncharacterized protein n=1 Tax=Dendrobium catenatum TaxID=906689 RepID=A0A2I0VT78_9ASPA|nr:hypothetical protein MA16_Dca022376 [Dendrobium catenatum]